MLRASGESDQFASALSQSVHHDRHRCPAGMVKPVLHCPRGFAWSGWQVALGLARSSLWVQVLECKQLTVSVLCSMSETAACGVCVRAS